MNSTIQFDIETVEVTNALRVLQNHLLEKANVLEVAGDRRCVSYELASYDLANAVEHLQPQKGLDLVPELNSGMDGMTI